VPASAVQTVPSTLPSWFPAGLAVLLLAVAAAALVPRFLAEAVVDDSDTFKEALKFWAPQIGRRRVTPRAIKRYMNRLRFLAMRLRDVTRQAEETRESPPLDEPALVTLSALEELDPEQLYGPRQESTGVDVGNAERLLEEFTRAFRRPVAIDQAAREAYRALSGIVEEIVVEPAPDEPEPTQPHPGARRPRADPRPAPAHRQPSARER
jgi:hypothetical protein